MASNTKVTLFKGGTAEREVLIRELKIPDLWHIAEAIRSKGKIENGEVCASMILECWHISHSLHQHIMEE